MVHLLEVLVYVHVGDRSSDDPAAGPRIGFLDYIPLVNGRVQIEEALLGLNVSLDLLSRLSVRPVTLYEGHLPSTWKAAEQRPL